MFQNSGVLARHKRRCASSGTTSASARIKVRAGERKIDRRDLREMRGYEARYVDAVARLAAIRRSGKTRWHGRSSSATINLSDDQLQEASQLDCGDRPDARNRPGYLEPRDRLRAGKGKIPRKDGAVGCPGRGRQENAARFVGSGHRPQRRFWRSIRLFDIRLYHPDASVPISITAGTFKPTVIALVKQGVREIGGMLAVFRRDHARTVRDLLRQAGRLRTKRAWS